jgi:DinB superfamily/Pentapeptide repeats (8 copies)
MALSAGGASVPIMADFTDAELSGSRFTDVRMRGAQLRNVDLSEADFRDVNFTRAVMRGVELVDVEIDGYIRNLTINEIDVVPLVNAELERRYPELVKLRPKEPAGFREAWDVLEGLWAGTVERAGQLDPALLHESVNEEWSFIETLRHLVFATDCWVKRAILGDPAPWHPLDLPHDQMPDTTAVPRDRTVQPSLDEVLELRRDRMATVRGVVDDLTEESLDARTEPVDAPGWPPPASYAVGECLLTVFDEEWSHRRYAERDLTILESGH